MKKLVLMLALVSGPAMAHDYYAPPPAQTWMNIAPLTSPFARPFGHYPRVPAHLPGYVSPGERMRRAQDVRFSRREQLAKPHQVQLLNVPGIVRASQAK